LSLQDAFISTTFSELLFSKPVARSHFLSYLPPLINSPPERSRRANFQLTLKNTETVEAFHMSGKSHDCGSKIGYMKAFVEYGLRHKEKGAEFSEFLKSIEN